MDVSWSRWEPGKTQAEAGAPVSGSRAGSKRSCLEWLLPQGSGETVAQSEVTHGPATWGMTLRTAGFAPVSRPLVAAENGASVFLSENRADGTYRGNSLQHRTCCRCTVAGGPAVPWPPVKLSASPPVQQGARWHTGTLAPPWVRPWGRRSDRMPASAKFAGRKINQIFNSLSFSS